MKPNWLESTFLFGHEYKTNANEKTFITAGIERMLRMVQAIAMVVLSQPALLSGFFKLVALGNQHVWTEPRIASIAVLSELRSNVALVRRFFRMFRFLESFSAAHIIYTSFYAPPPPPPAASAAPAPNMAPATTSQSTNDEKAANETQEDSRQAEPSPSAPTHTHGPHCRHHHKPRDPNKIPTEAWLDIFSRTFNGMYLLLETLTLLDALRLPGFSLWGAAWFTVLHVEGQRFWFLALVCGLLSGLLKMAKLVAYGPVPPPRTGEGYGTGGKSAAAATEEMPEWQRQRERMRRVVYAQRERRKAWRREISTTGYKLARRCVADCLDLAVPGSVVGWVKVQSGTVGAVMVISTWLTGLEVWERCG